MSLFFPGPYASPLGRQGNALGIAWAIIVHAALLAVVALGIGQSEVLREMARPLAVRLVEAVRPAEKPPAPPPKMPPKAQPKMLKAPVLATAAPSAPSSFVVPEQPPVPVAPVVVANPNPAPAVEPLVEARFDANYLSNPKPPYPSASRRLGEAGTVYLRVHVSAEGQAHKVELKTSSGFPRLDQSALDTVAQWRFVPAKRGSTAVTSWVVVPVVFSLT
ncbi:MAG: energy transducer TonB [Proteobacteria bacterium]|nr:energy transducer TonB [Pseudomonadota bacterium]